MPKVIAFPPDSAMTKEKWTHAVLADIPVVEVVFQDGVVYFDMKYLPNDLRVGDVIRVRGGFYTIWKRIIVPPGGYNTDIPVIYLAWIT